MRHNALHARDHLPLADGNFRSITIRDLDSLGVTVWAGALRPDSVGKAPVDVGPEDYAYLETVSFRSLEPVWEYFSRRGYSVLVAELRYQASVTGEYPAVVVPDLDVADVRKSVRVRGWLRMLAVRSRRVAPSMFRLQRSA